MAPSSVITVHAAPLIPSAFAPFGDVFISPLPYSTTTPPNPPPHGSIAANQGTALKFPDIAPFISTYHTSPSGAPARPSMSLFSCFPQALRTSKGQQIFDVQVLERHPYTTQTFIPLTSTTVNTAKAIIIVTPTLPTPPPPPPSPPALTPYFPQLQSKKAGLPDLRNLKAFVAEPGMGITYGVGTWHAPMVVVEGRVDFVAVQHVSGKGDEDCQEVDVQRVEIVVRGASSKL